MIQKLFQTSKTHNIYYNNVCIQIPIDMTVSEFKKYMNIRDTTSGLLYTNSHIELFADEKFTSNKHYSSSSIPL